MLVHIRIYSNDDEFEEGNQFVEANEVDLLKGKDGRTNKVVINNGEKTFDINKNTLVQVWRDGIIIVEHHGSHIQEKTKQK